MILSGRCRVIHLCYTPAAFTPELNTMYSTNTILKDQLARAEADRDYWHDQALIALADLAKAHAVIVRHLDRTQ